MPKTEMRPIHEIVLDAALSCNVQQPKIRRALSQLQVRFLARYEVRMRARRYMMHKSVLELLYRALDTALVSREEETSTFKA